MKLIVRILLIILRWIIIFLILLFSVATLIGKSFVQTGLLWLLILALAWWPPYFKNRWNNAVALAIRLVLAFALLIVSFTAFKPDPKTSIYLTGQLEEELMGIYDEKVSSWPVGTESIFIDTECGKVHVLACGKKENPPLVMIHAASMGAHSWEENLDPLLDHYRIYSIDNIGEGNRSALDDVLVYPNNQQEVADHLASILDRLGVESAPLFGASNGGSVALCFAYHFPGRVESLALFGPMGLTKLTGKSIMMLSIATMYPFQFVRDRVTRWAIGDDPYVTGKYGDWFNCIMKGTIPSVARPVPMNSEQKAEMNIPVLLFLGNKDQIVGDAEIARQTAEIFPNIRIEILESGHLIAVEQADHVNSIVKAFLGLPAQ